MNKGVHVVRNKQVYNLKFLDKGLRRYLEEKSGHPLTKIRLMVETPSFARWMLEGIEDKNYGYRKVGSLFQELCPLLGSLWGGDLLRICRKVDSNYLILDFKRKDDLFRTFTEGELREMGRDSLNKAEYIKIL